MILHQTKQEPLLMTDAERLLLLPFVPVCDCANDVKLPHIPGSRIVTLDFSAACEQKKASKPDLALEA